MRAFRHHLSNHGSRAARSLAAIAFTICLASLCEPPPSAHAQAPDSAGISAPTSKAPTTPTTPSSTNPANPSSLTVINQQRGTSPAKTGPGVLGTDVPLFNPGSETFTWDGKSWNILNNRLFRARFEKFLNAPAATTEEDAAYRQIFERLMKLVEPNRRVDIDDAFSLLPQASRFAIDANLCDSLASAIYSVWLSQRQEGRLARANEALKKEAETLRWNSQVGARSSKLDSPPSDPTAAAEWAKEKALERDLRLGGYIKRLAEIEVILKTNDLKSTASELQTKIEFQTLLFQFFVQRRFQHVVLGNRFYRALFGDGDTKLHLSEDAKKLLTINSGLPPTLGLLDTLANEAMRDVDEGVEAYKYQLAKGELDGATRRLQETFLVGEYMPSVRLLNREDKRKSLIYFRKQNELLTALSSRDFDRAEELVTELKGMANDWDSSVQESQIKTARQAAQLLLSKAKLAASRGDTKGFESAMAEAMNAWPLNPDIQKVTGQVFQQVDTKQQALADFERLVSQKNYRQIFEEQAKYLVATAMLPEKQAQLREILEKMAEVEKAIIRANEIAKRGDHAGGWEAIERVSADHPNDVRLNRLHKELTSQAASFVNSLNTARELEEDRQYGSSLAWYLKARQLYPASEFAREGIDRVASIVLPETDG